MITIRKMNEVEFEFSKGKPHETYIQGMVRAQKIPLEKAKEIAKKQIQEILPEGFHTPNHFFYSVILDEKLIGYAWFQAREESIKTAWGYDIYIEEEYRRQGFAKKVFEQLSIELKEAGFSQMSFHVYADNKPAISLYEKFGFETTNIVMRKEL